MSTYDTNLTERRVPFTDVPTKCEGSGLSTCRVHVNYHGCTDNSWPTRLIWVRNINLNEYAEANGIVVVYPQVDAPLPPPTAHCPQPRSPAIQDEEAAQWPRCTLRHPRPSTHR